jgi:hypothetical protein
LDLSANTALITLNCKNNQLTTLDLSNNSALQNLNCEINRTLTEIRLWTDPTIIRTIDVIGSMEGFVDEGTIYKTANTTLAGGVPYGWDVVNYS